MPKQPRPPLAPLVASKRALRSAIAFAASAVAITVAGCSNSSAAPMQPSPASEARKAANATPASAHADNNELLFRGMCDASGAVTLGGTLFAVADDEDNILRVYDSARGGEPVASIDVSPALALPMKKKTPEADIEGATKLGDRALWITSHGRNSKGKLQPGRFRFFSTTAPKDGVGLTPVGTAYEGLLEDMLQKPELAALHLAAASELAPKEPGGLNLEGLTERADGKSVLLGFRSPRPNGKALLVPLLNPLAIIDGARAQLGEPILLDLGGLGVRALSFWRGHYLIVGGAVSDEAPSKIFVWRGEGDTPRAVDIDLRGLNPEGFVSYDDKHEVLLLSDDGSATVGGVPCKKQTDVSLKRFRGLWTKVPGVP